MKTVFTFLFWLTFRRVIVDGNNGPNNWQEPFDGIFAEFPSNSERLLISDIAQYLRQLLTRNQILFIPLENSSVHRTFHTFPPYATRSRVLSHRTGCRTVGSRSSVGTRRKIVFAAFSRRGATEGLRFGKSAPFSLHPPRRRYPRDEKPVSLPSRVSLRDEDGRRRGIEVSVSERRAGRERSGSESPTTDEERRTRGLV